MITHAELLTHFPALSNPAIFAPEKTAFWASKAPLAFPAGRLRDPKHFAVAERFYVAHMHVHTAVREGNAVDLQHIPAPKTASDKRRHRAAGSWKTSVYGMELAKIVKI